MNSKSKTTALIQAHLAPPEGMMFYSSLESAQSDAAMLGYISVIERAWREIKLDGVLCLDRRPLMYVKEHARPFFPFERIRLQRLFWNQGVANVLVLADPVSVCVYSGLAEPPHARLGEEASEDALVETMARLDYIQGVQALYHALATGHYYEAHQEHFKPEQSVDSWLLNNLCALRDDLIKGGEGISTKDAHAFIGRMLFLCYLLDRGIVPLDEPNGDSTELNGNHTGTMAFTRKLEQLDNQSRVEYLYALFGDLKHRFNGNMFDQDLEAEKHLMRPTHMKTLVEFLGGHRVADGQRTLGFWPYDFKMIPIETISAIYQDFLSTEDQERQKRSGAFYTPRFLAEMVVDVALGSDQDSLNWTFLDPACGSGIFLVILFNRLANHWIRSQTSRAHYVTKANALQAILERQISGVDVEETACRIACFSLYLAYLDFFDPPDIQSYIEKTKRPLPKLLDYGVRLDRPQADLPVIHKADFLDDNRLSGKTFDCIIGNPPWEGRQSKQLAQKFMRMAPHFLRQGGTGCLLLPSKMLQNQTNSFQGEWLRQVTLERVLQLADYRYLLFQNAWCPAIIVRFKNAPSEVGTDAVEFVAPKFNRDALRQGVVTVDPSARKWIPLSDILSATQSNVAPVVWKRHLWGTPRDQKLLDLLQSLSPLSELAGKPEEHKRWIKGQGLQPYYKERAETLHDYPRPTKNPWGADTPFVAADKPLQMLTFPIDCTSLGERLKIIGASTEHLRRAPKEELFKAPMVLVSQGFGKVAFCDFDVLFQDSLQSIAGPREDADLLMFLAVYLRSSLARYFLFHTSANWGSERDKVHLTELLRVPFPLPDDEGVHGIVKHVARQVQQLRDELKSMFGTLNVGAELHLFDRNQVHGIKGWLRERRRRVDALQRQLEPMVYRYFGLTEQEIILIEDTIHVFEPSSTPTTWRSPQTVTLDSIEKTAVQPYATQGLRAYADTLASTLNQWAQSEKSEYEVRVEGAVDNRTGLVVVTVNPRRVGANDDRKHFSGQVAQILKKAHARSSKRVGTLLYQRDLFLFQKDRILIVRPDILSNWTRTAALNDAAKIYGEIALIRQRAR